MHSSEHHLARFSLPKMWLICEIFVVIFKMFVFTLEGMFRAIVPGPKKDIRGQIVLITGAGGGLGRQLALEFSNYSVTFVLWDINKETNEDTAALLRSRGKQVHTYVCDCSKREDVYRVAEKVKVDVGDVDILVNNAGILVGKQLMRLKDEEMQRTMDINIMAHFWTTRAFLPSMMEKNRGHIVTIASLAGVFGAYYLTDYCASKFAAVGFTDALSLELRHLGINGVKTTCIQPFFINTGLCWYPKSRFPKLFPILEPDDVAKLTVDAVLRDQAVLRIPSQGLILMMKNILPEKALLVLGKFFQVGLEEQLSKEEKKIY